MSELPLCIRVALYPGAQRTIHVAGTEGLLQPSSDYCAFYVIYLYIEPSKNPGFCKGHLCPPEPSKPARAICVLESHLNRFWSAELATVPFSKDHPQVL